MAITMNATAQFSVQQVLGQSNFMVSIPYLIY